MVREPEFRCEAPSSGGLLAIFLVMSVGFGALGGLLWHVGVTGPAVILGLLTVVGVVMGFMTRPRERVIIARPSGLELRLPELRRRVEWSEALTVQPRALDVMGPEGRLLCTLYSAEVTLSDGAHFVINQDWDGHHQILGCIALQRFDPLADYDIPSQSLVGTAPVRPTQNLR